MGKQLMTTKIAELNVQTNELTFRNLTDDELKIYQAELVLFEKIEKERLKVETEKNALRQSALEKLAAFGLTEAEIQALAG